MNIDFNSTIIATIVGGFLAIIPTWIQKRDEYKRWKIDKRITFLKEELTDLEKKKKDFLINLQRVFAGERFTEDSNIVTIFPMEVIDVLKKHFGNGTTHFKDLSHDRKQKILVDTAEVLEKKIAQLRKEIKTLISE